MTPTAMIDHLIAELWAGLNEMHASQAPAETRRRWITGMLDAIEYWEAQ